MEAALKGKYAPDLFARASKYTDRGANPKLMDKYRELSRQSAALPPPPKAGQHPAKITRTVEATPPVVPDKTVVTPEMAQQFKSDQILDKADRVRSSSGHIATFIAVLDGMRGIFSGNPAEVGLDVAGRVGYAVGKEQFARMLEHPSVVNYLSNLTPGDVDQIMRLPPDQRSGFTSLIQQAQTKGIKVPQQALVGLGIATSVGTDKKKRLPIPPPPKYGAKEVEPGATLPVILPPPPG
jgi:hypothetical protein